MKKLLLAALVVTTVLEGIAQQQPVLSQYMLNQYYFNPAYTGSGELYKFTLLHRAQWSGYQDYEGNTSAPEIQMFTATANLDSTGHGFGLLLSRDKAGPITTFQAQLSYAYSVKITGKSTLAVGVRGGIVTKSIDFDTYIVKHTNDKFIEEGKQSETQPDVTLGLFYNHEKYYLGVSAKGLVTQADFNSLGLENERAVMFTGGYQITIGHEWKLTPNIQTITTADRTMVQGGAIVSHSNMFWAGLAYRHEEAATVLTGFSMLKGKALVSYAFDYTTGIQSAKGSTSHEFMIAYQLGKLHPKKKAK